MSSQDDNIARSVMEQINSGKVQMKPRRYYTILTITSVLAVGLAGLSLAYLSSILFFWLRIQTADTMAWGARANLDASVDSFPWWALIASVILSIVAILIVRHQGRLYKHKTSTIALILVTSALVIGFGLSYFDIGKSHVSPRENQPGQQRGNGLQRNQ